MKLEDIGFYTLSDERAANPGKLMRAEMVLTNRCNFNCPYCRKTGEEMTLSDALLVLGYWIEDGLQHVRFSGGEPTMWFGLDILVATAKAAGVRRIALSTNGSAPGSLYRRLIDMGVDDFSISLDACCASTGNRMSGTKGHYQTVIDNIKALAAETYVTVGVVVTEENSAELYKVLDLADSLGVSDIRVIPAAQDGRSLQALREIPWSLTHKYPILYYRHRNSMLGRGCRGLEADDCHTCGLVVDDTIVSGRFHYPCIIHMREGGAPIGPIGPNMMEQREDWCDRHDSWTDPICKANCLDVCIDFNNERGCHEY